MNIIAPTNAAFAALPGGLLDTLLLPEYKGALAEILLYHVVGGSKVTSGDLGNGDVLTTLANGATVAVSVVGGNIKINDSNVIEPFDIVASNGIIHAIDKVLIPPIPEPEEACNDAIVVDVRKTNPPNGVKPTGGIVDGKTTESGTCSFPFFLDKSPLSWFKVFGTGNVLTASTCSEDSKGSTSVPTSVLVFSGCGDWTND